MDFEDPQPDLPRLVPERPLPPYRYVPGRNPHPVRHADGHLRGRPPEPAPAPGCASWTTSLRHGTDLFNHGFYWEAHEVWEELWHGVPSDSPLGQLLQGLIQAAAAMLKHRMEHMRACARLGAAARARLAYAARNGCDQVEDLDEFLGRLDRWLVSDPDAAFPTLRVC